MTRPERLNSINKFMISAASTSLEHEQRIKSLESQLRIETENKNRYKELWIKEQNINSGRG